MLRRESSFQQSRRSHSICSRACPDRLGWPQATRAGRALLISLTGAMALVLAGCPRPHAAMPVAPVSVSQPVLVLQPPPPLATPPPVPPVQTHPAGTLAPHLPVPRRHHRPYRRRRIYIGPSPAPPPPAAPAKKPAPSQLDLSAGLSPQQQIAYRQTALQWLAISRNDLAAFASRRLSPSQQANRAQALEYIQQAQRALGRGDVERARSLAYKAMLLAQALR